MKINTQIIEDNVIQGELKKALMMLLKLTKKYDIDIYNSVVMLMGRYNSLQKDIESYTILPEEANINRNRINYSLIQILSKTKASWEIDEEEYQSDKPNTKPELKRILFLAANPKDTLPLRLDEEVKKISESLKRSSKRELFELIQKWAIQISDLSRALLDETPNIIHFSGHGSRSGRIILEDDQGNSQEVPPKALGSFFELFQDKIECVILNACYSESQAQEIAKSVPYVIGMNEAVPDEATIAFSQTFYDAIASGQPIEFAFKLAKITVEMYDLNAENIPILIHNT